MTRSAKIYLRSGVREVWFIRPESQRVEVHLPENLSGGEPARTLHVGEELTTPLLPRWSVPVADLFA